jgi:hypothetical protein
MPLHLLDSMALHDVVGSEYLTGSWGSGVSASLPFGVLVELMQGPQSYTL